MHFSLSSLFALALPFLASYVVADAQDAEDCYRMNAKMDNINAPPTPLCRDFQTSNVWASLSGKYAYCNRGFNNDKTNITIDGGLANGVVVTKDAEYGTTILYTVDEQGRIRTENYVELYYPTQRHQIQLFPSNIKARIYVQFEGGTFVWTDSHGRVHSQDNCRYGRAESFEQWVCVFWRLGDGDQKCR